MWNTEFFSSRNRSNKCLAKAASSNDGEAVEDAGAGASTGGTDNDWWDADELGLTGTTESSPSGVEEGGLAGIVEEGFGLKGDPLRHLWFRSFEAFYGRIPFCRLWLGTILLRPLFRHLRFIGKEEAPLFF